MQRLRTQTLTGAGKEPIWANEHVNIDVKYVGDDLHLAVMDENVSNNDAFGASTIKLSALCENGGVDEWFEIEYKESLAGHVHLKSQWKPNGGQLTELPKPQEVPRPDLYYTNCTIAPPVQYAPAPIMAQLPFY